MNNPAILDIALGFVLHKHSEMNSVVKIIKHRLSVRCQIMNWPRS